MPKVLYADLNRCIYCRACEVACEREHFGISRMYVTLIEERLASPVSCRHCERSPCVQVCPTDAIERTDEGAVLIHWMKCIGCRRCEIVCPFGVIELDTLERIVAKCDLCIHRLQEGREPACVATCPSRALRYDEFETIMADARRRAGLSFVTAVGNVGTVLTLPDRALGEGGGDAASSSMYGTAETWEGGKA